MSAPPAYVLAKSPVTVTILGAKNVPQVSENVAAVEHPLPPEEVARIREITQTR